MSEEIKHVVVIVPALDEQDHITSCLHAVQRACADVHAEVKTSVVVVANRCADRTVEHARLAGAHVLVSEAPNVGAARHEGALWAIGSALKGMAAERLWLACTDADSTVPPTWLRTQIREAARGADAVVGTIMLSADGMRRHPRWVAKYLRVSVSEAQHGHVHGANLGVRASTYVAVGGFEPVAVHEDRRLVNALVAHRARLAWVKTAPVQTSERHESRVSGGVAADLQESE